MFNRLIHSHFTWIIVPLALAGMFWWAMARALEPIPEKQLKHVIEQVTHNLEIQSEGTRLQANLVTWFDPAEHAALFRKEPTLMRALTYSTYYQDWNSLVSVAKRNPLAYGNLFDDLKASFDKIITRFPDASLKSWDALAGIRKFAAANAVQSVEAGNSDAVIKSLKFVAEVSDHVAPQDKQWFPVDDSWYYDAIHSITSVTTDSAVLDQLQSLLENKPDQILGATMASGPVLQRLLPIEHLRQASQIISRNGLMVAGDYNKDYYNDASRINENRDDPFQNTPPWTSTIMLTEKSLRALAATEDQWKDRIPSGYLDGLSGRERLIGAAILLWPRAYRNSHYLGERREATRQEIAKAGIAARRYYLATGQMPQGIEDLKQYGFESPPKTDAVALAEVLENDDSPLDSAAPFGPITLQTIEPDAEDVRVYLEASNSAVDLDVTAGEDGDTSTGLVTASVSVVLTNGPGTWQSYGHWLMRLPAEAKVTSLTVAYGDNIASFPGLQFLDIDTTAGLAGMTEFQRQVAGQFLQTLENSPDHISYQPNEKWPGVESTGFYKVTMEVSVPAQLVKIALPSEAIEKIAKVQAGWVEPVYLAKPREQ